MRQNAHASRSHAIGSGPSGSRLARHTAAPTAATSTAISTAVAAPRSPLAGSRIESLPHGVRARDAGLARGGRRVALVEEGIEREVVRDAPVGHGDHALHQVAHL